MPCLGFFAVFYEVCSDKPCFPFKTNTPHLNLCTVQLMKRYDATPGPVCNHASSTFRNSGRAADIFSLRHSNTKNTYLKARIIVLQSCSHLAVCASSPGPCALPAYLELLLLLLQRDAEWLRVVTFMSAASKPH